MANKEFGDLDYRAINMAKALAADAVQKAGNGHPGTAVSLAPAAYLVYQKYLRHNPSNTDWAGRDRFILSMGHSSLTLYLQLFLTGAGLEVGDLQELRQWGSLTPGHPEYKHTRGVEMTTGPLGQGIATAVGFAAGAKYETELLDKGTGANSPFHHNVYVFAGDGDLQEGISMEAASLAGTLGLGNLIVLWDDNHISIEGDTKIAFNEDVLARYEAQGWHTQRVNWLNGAKYNEDLDALSAAYDEALAVTDKPSIIALRTLIAYPTPNKTNTGAAHGSALGEDNIRELKSILGIDPDKHFYVDEAALNHSRRALERGADLENEWQKKFDAWKSQHPSEAKLYERIKQRELPADIHDKLPTFDQTATQATRTSFGEVINALAPHLPELWGGSADLAGSNNTTIKNSASFGPKDISTESWECADDGRVLHFGIREHAMAAMLNGIVLGSDTRAFGGTFFPFSDYMRPAVRLAALMGIPSVYVWTHDSIAVGEDGPTHQPIEHLAAMRAIPNLDVVRPADAHETAECFLQILRNTDNPAGLILSRQNLPVIDQNSKFNSAKNAAKGGYVLYRTDKSTAPDVILIATGSEVHLAISAIDALEKDGLNVQIVSMPSFEWFEAQDEAYKKQVLPAGIRNRVSIEAGIKMPWHKYIGDHGAHIGIEHYGASAPAETVLEKFGFTVENVVKAVHEVVK
ncbi:MAG: transketolase [Bifidobacteriaceae bacterium]|jgi:transketolase|nr:transketolase [Bifidobacteriaceae bacterium]